LGEACGFFFADALEFGGYALLDLEFKVALAGRVGLFVWCSCQNIVRIFFLQCLITSGLFCSESTTEGEKLTGLSLLRAGQYKRRLSHWTRRCQFVRSKDILRAFRLGASGTHSELNVEFLKLWKKVQLQVVDVSLVCSLLLCQSAKTSSDCSDPPAARAKE
jgi:hypothetical protein